MKFLVPSALIPLLALVTIETRAGAQSPVPVTKCGQVLNQPGEYVFTGALDKQECPGFSCSSAGGAITISASNIHLDTAGHGVNAICAAVVIVDGVRDVRIDGGGWLLGGSGLIIGKDSRVVVNKLSDIHGDPDLGSTETGIEIRGANHVTVSDNNIEGVFGIHGQVDDGVFVNNKISGLNIVNNGIVLSGKNNVIKNNTVTLSGLSAENNAISVTDQNRIKGNTIHQAAVGISLAGNSNIVVRNRVDGASPPSVPVASVYGIYVGQGAAGNKIECNTSIGNEFDLYQKNGPPCLDIWRKNHYQTSGGAVACIH